MKNTIILSLLFLSIGFGSCTKFLSERSEDQLVPTTTVDFLELLNGQGYPGFEMGDAVQRGMLLMDDDIQMNNIYKIASFNNDGNKNTINALLPVYVWQPNSYESVVENTMAGGKDNFNAWGGYYALIMGTNNALDNAGTSIGSDADKAYLKGQAYGLRAYYYFMLANFYGKPYNAADPNTSLAVPLVLTATKYDPNNLYKSRNTVKEVYTQITKDLDSAILYLEIGKRTKPYRMNHLAAHLLASRVHLYMEQWDQAIAHASVVLANKPGLMSLTTAIPVTRSTDPNTILGSTNIETLWTFGSATDYLFMVSSSQLYRLSDNFLKCFTGNDLRTKNTFIRNDVVGWQYGYTMQTNKQYTSTSQAMKAFRVAEAYLNRAEAYVQKSKLDSAAADLNTLRAARYTAPAVWSATTTNLLDSSRMERRKELFMEDHRWFDLRRYGMPSISHVFYRGATDSVTYTLTPQDKQYVWPIPQEVIDRNNKIVQNPLSPMRLAQ